MSIIRVVYLFFNIATSDTFFFSYIQSVLLVDSLWILAVQVQLVVSSQTLQGFGCVQRYYNGSCKGKLASSKGFFYRQIPCVSVFH